MQLGGGKGGEHILLTRLCDNSILHEIARLLTSIITRIRRWEEGFRTRLESWQTPNSWAQAGMEMAFLVPNNAGQSVVG